MPHVIDVVAVVVLLFSWARGFGRGAARAVLDIARIVCAYWAAWQYARPIGGWLARHVDLSALAATVLGGIAVFVAVSVCFGFIESWFRTPKRRRDKARHPSGRPLGGLIGLATGAITVVVLCWLYGAARTSPWGERLPSGEGSRAMRLSQQLMGHGAYLALKGKVSSPDRARRLAAMVSDPEGTTVRLRSVAQNPKFTRLVADSAFGQALRSGETSEIMGNPRLQALLADEPTMKQLARMGIVPEDWRTPQFRNALGTELARVGGRIDTVMEDSVTQATVARLKDEGLLAPEKLPQLMTDSRFLSLVERVMSEIGAHADTLENP
ncbi:CvpA family protein [Candidatus Fermentibacteria bacterium]|nr:CvpA family protein [Candidatus Fermentibacteria bacterium]